MNQTKKIPALSRFRQKAVLARLKLSERLGAARPFLLAFLVTLSLIGLTAGWTAAGLRCRMAADPPQTEAALFVAREGYLKLRFLDFSAELRLEIIPLRGGQAPAGR